ncbi:MAG: hypothetical protein CVV52_08620 [Spirochaetae bacterium HGW-Spirochaetae-8]|nr:MAG: hypothetical protein CVV52_08620 [Spirochaetae bacterium HGW-Spirochaetae-8]
MSKRLFMLLCVLVLVASLTAVFGAGRAETGKVVIGLSMVQQDSDWWATQERMLRQAIEAEGWEAVTVWAAGDQSKQISDVEDLIARKVDYIIMGPIQQAGSVVAVDNAANAGIPVLLVGRLSDSKNSYASVVAHEPLFGSLQIEQIHKDFPNGANIVYLYGPVGAGYAVQMWELGTLPTLAKYPNIKILFRYDHQSDITSQGMASAEDAITRFGSQIDAIAATNDGLGLGGVRAVQAAGLGDKIKVYGAGLTMMGIQAVYDGTMQYTTLKSQAKNAAKLIELVKLAISGGKPTEKVVMIPPTVVTKENCLTVADPMFGGTFTEPGTFQPKK